MSDINGLRTTKLLIEARMEGLLAELGSLSGVLEKVDKTLSALIKKPKSQPAPQETIRSAAVNPQPSRAPQQQPQRHQEMQRKQASVEPNGRVFYSRTVPKEFVPQGLTSDSFERKPTPTPQRTLREASKEDRRTFRPLALMQEEIRVEHPSNFEEFEEGDDTPFFISGNGFINLESFEEEYNE